uniref:F-box domain containing protein, putative n=1 Tax=Solanum demissum TaxID=50514 RepID=Q6L3U5_SOLDE|nr:F-box domain containing protein, putative [Solanum demissum]
MAESIISVLPHEIIIKILLKVPPKSLLKFTCVSKSWLELISSTKFIKNHLKSTGNDKECSHHRIIFQESACNFKETVLWNPAINKSKKLPTFGAKLRNNCSYNLKYAFGYDEACDDYKVVVSLFMRIVLYWALSADVDTFNMCNIISLDLADETWRRLELPDSNGKGNYPLALGVVGGQISVLCLNYIEGTNSDVWIMKDCGVKVSWKKIFTIDHSKDLGEFIFFTSIFFLPCYQSNKNGILLLLPPVIMTYNGSTRQVEVVDQLEECTAAEIYVESLVDPLLIS